MTRPIASGSKCLLDGKTEVIVLKSSNRSNSVYSVEIPGKSIEMVSADRLRHAPNLYDNTGDVEIFDYES